MKNPRFRRESPAEGGSCGDRSQAGEQEKLFNVTIYNNVCTLNFSKAVESRLIQFSWHSVTSQ